MNLCVSQLAWDSDSNSIFFEHLKNNGINKIECVFNKIINGQKINEKLFLNFKNLADSFEIEIYSAQSLFFGVDCKNFDDPLFIEHFKFLIDMSSVLSLKILVFGSPSLRKNSSNTQNISDTFLKIDELLTNSGLELSIEPNARSYGGDFFYTPFEIIEFIKKNNFSNIKTMIDTHNLEMENLNFLDEFKKYSNEINHIHISEKKLIPILDFQKYEKLLNLIKLTEYSKTITLEIIQSELSFQSIQNFNNFFNIEI
jgi:sugar phosphate isomerase/epimerase